MLFRNRTAVITGAAGRIGRATSLALGKQGVKLYLADIKLDALQEFVKELAAENIDATAVMMDVTSLESIRNAADEILRSAGKVDILVNNAGSWPQKSLIDTDDELWNFSLELNLSSVFRVTKAFLPSMLEQ
ncbi:MAG: SDR family oxidoreductase [Lentisphaeria bacterium]|nr:SDR family oxidoreductase [Lentisphaeria bacterium]